MEYYKNLDLAPINYFCDYDLEWKTEEWLDIPDYLGYYQVSDLGRVKSLSGTIITKSGVIKPKNELIMRQTVKSNGYLSIMFSVESNLKRFHVHRLVAISFIENPELKPEVNHKNCIKTHNYKMNLEWNTVQENKDHAVLNDLNCKGERASWSKLSNEKIFAIRRLYRINPNFHKSNVAKKLGVRDTTIHKIIRGQRWKHLL